jgi:type II secretory pathway pseudopilin PulG
MLSNTLKSCNGFTYIAALVLVMIMGIMLGAAGQSWSMIMKREVELLFRGNQIMYTIADWYKSGQGRQAVPLKDLKDLLKDPHSAATVRYLRKLYKDPITGKDWTPIIDQARGGIVGVVSTSEEKPIKQDFTDYLKDTPQFKTFGKKNKYSEWQFDYRLIGGYGKAPLPGQM